MTSFRLLATFSARAPFSLWAGKTPLPVAEKGGLPAAQPVSFERWVKRNAFFYTAQKLIPAQCAPLSFFSSCRKERQRRDAKLVL